MLLQQNYNIRYKNLSTLLCNFNKIRVLNTKNLKHLECKYNKIRKIKIRDKLSYLDCSNNRIKSINYVQDTHFHSNKIKDLSRVFCRGNNKYLNVIHPHLISTAESPLRY